MEVVGGRCIRGSDEKVCFCEKESDEVWRDYMDGIMNEENEWDHRVEIDAVEGTEACASRAQVLQALNEVKTLKAPGLSEVSLEMIAS